MAAHTGDVLSFFRSFVRTRIGSFVCSLVRLWVRSFDRTRREAVSVAPSGDACHRRLARQDLCARWSGQHLLLPGTEGACVSRRRSRV